MYHIFIVRVPIFSSLLPINTSLCSDLDASTIEDEWVCQRVSLPVVIGAKNESSRVCNELVEIHPLYITSVTIHCTTRLFIEFTRSER